MDADNSGAPPARGPALADYLIDFPAPLAVAGADLGLGTIISWSSHGVNDLTSALELFYEQGPRLAMAITTIRSTRGIDPRGLPLETPALHLSNFLARAAVHAHSDRYRFDPEDPGPVSDPAARLEHERRTQHATDQAPRSTVTVLCDGRPVTGRRVTALEHSVIELPWHDEHTVLCVGTQDILDKLTLRTSTPEDLAHL
ncbi:hypothetical protein SAMN04489729_1561 [Amycolatopsis lurida]|uniref:Uncharacterized protein n=1 Tax=Amycolatopsis lurida NRRL 2430 TaxID=1460371 RepID=A0A2P2FZ91_AMYLU|nr:hypothetical protein [Amycolatopsis lurida]KFU82048.1 hypothetical protein BB31_06825 [Amycolatopsis lurida NRRL 2430]SEC43286.1 hypothetical protein SAMN04489729_1561 [Amycolatopsis lurida]